MADTPRINPTPPAPDRGSQPTRERQGITDVPGNAQRQTPNDHGPDGHEGATEDQVSDRTGPGVGYDQEPEPEPGEAGVS
jgi:hypothetical protein